jgi:CelD/BcsL family acetyltransferase involved in cellulose biosynthesis
MLLWFAPARAQEQVDVEIVFLADASNSIDAAEIRFQRQGYAEALQHPEVLSAIAKGATQKIAVSFIEWGSTGSQDVVVPWMVIDGAGSAAVFAQALLAAPRRAFGSNAIGEAIAVAQAQIEGNVIEGFRKVIDLSADSANSWSGISIAQARANALAAGIIINGLAVLCREDDCSGRPVSYDLEKAFADTIIGGPGSFVVPADDARSFAAAVRRKLILELADGAPPRTMLR